LTTQSWHTRNNSQITKLEFTNVIKEEDCE
jgi:hypothetical protein